MPLAPTFVDQPPPPLSRGNSVVSLYQSCLNLLERLSGVPDFEEYLDPEMLQSTQAGTPSSSGSSPNDPVHQLWGLFRLGSPLACIFNGLRPKEPLKINNADTSLSNVNACKASVFRFLVACRQELQFSEDDLFTISELYQDDTNGFVKVCWLCILYPLSPPSASPFLFPHLTSKSQRYKIPSSPIQSPLPGAHPTTAPLCGPHRQHPTCTHTIMFVITLHLSFSCQFSFSQLGDSRNNTEPIMPRDVMDIRSSKPSAWSSIAWKTRVC